MTEAFCLLTLRGSFLRAIVPGFNDQGEVTLDGRKK